MTRFLIIAPARSGSTLLREMLNRHPEVCCHGEVFGVHRVLGHSTHAMRALDPELALKLRRRDPVAFLEAQVFASKRPVTGFKLLYSQMLQMEFAPVLQRLIEMPDLRVVHLWRRDLIARHVSEARLRLKAAQRQAAPGTGATLEHALRPALVERACRINLAGRACAVQLFARQPAMALDYEHFIEDQAAQSTRLCSFLGVDPQRWPPLPDKGGEPSDPEIDRLKRLPALQAYQDHA
jgi:LPS sulfotransferase NodH